jgi:hypothetical protein
MIVIITIVIVLIVGFILNVIDIDREIGSQFKSHCDTINPTAVGACWFGWRKDLDYCDDKESFIYSRFNYRSLNISTSSRAISKGINL